MVHNHTKCPVIARCDLLQPHLTQHSQFWSIFDKRTWKGYVWLMTPANGIYCIIWHLMVPYGLLWEMLANYGQEYKFEQVSPFKAKLNNLGLVYQITACTTLRDKIGQISCKVAYNSPVFVTVTRYDRLGPYLSLYNLFWAVLWLSVVFDWISIKETLKRESVQKYSIIIQYKPL